jgi:hypothetical protein
MLVAMVVIDCGWRWLVLSGGMGEWVLLVCSGGRGNVDIFI